MRQWLVLCVALAACDQGTPTCKQAVMHVRDLVTTERAAMLIGTCELTMWPLQLKQCVAHAKSRREIDACEADPLGKRARALSAIRDRMCACKEEVCATRVAHEMDQWSQQMAHEAPITALSEDEGTMFEDYGRCMREAGPVPDFDEPPTTAKPMGYRHRVAPRVDPSSRN